MRHKLVKARTKKVHRSARRKKVSVMQGDKVIVMERKERSTSRRYPIDIDIKKPDSKLNPNWTFWASARNPEVAEDMVSRYVKPTFGNKTQARLVKASTGRVLKTIR